MFSFIKRLFFNTQKEKETTDLKIDQVQSDGESSEKLSDISYVEPQTSSTLYLVEESTFEIIEPYIPKSTPGLYRPSTSYFYSSSQSESSESDIEIVTGYLTFDSDDDKKKSTTNENKTIIKYEQNTFQEDSSQSDSSTVSIHEGYLQFTEEDKELTKVCSFHSEKPRKAGSNSKEFNNQSDKNPNPKEQFSVSKNFFSPSNTPSNDSKKKKECPLSQSKTVQFGPQKPSNENEDLTPRKPILRKQSSDINSKTSTQPNSNSIKQSANSKFSKTSSLFDHSFVENSNSNVFITPKNNKTDISTISVAKEKRNKSQIVNIDLIQSNDSQEKSKSVLQERNRNLLSTNSNKKRNSKLKRKDSKNSSDKEIGKCSSTSNSTQILKFSSKKLDNSKTD